VSESLEAIKRVIDAFERSEWSEIDVRWGDVHVHLATGRPPAAPTGPPASSPRDRSTSTEKQDVAPVDAATAGAPAAPVGARVVVSPSPGIVWRSPEPGAPPFAEVGQTVAASDTLCIVEVMKLMNHIKAGVGGEVVAVYGENGVAVDKGQPLFAIAPAEEP
jgi:acetyl-CoA carboxylase biotin carboxyl carrier protein